MTSAGERVLLTAPYMLLERERFVRAIEERGYAVIVPPFFAERLEEEQLLSLVPDVVGAIVGDDRFTRRVLLTAGKLRVIWKWGTGIDGIDRVAADELGIGVFNTPGAFSDPVADTVLGLVLNFARNIVTSDRVVKNGEWRKLAGYSLRELTLGVIGVGNVGTAVLQRARAFGMSLLANDVREVDFRQDSLESTPLISLDELLRRSDFVSINCDLNSSSRRMIGVREFALMKRTAVLINTARGGIVDERAMIDALVSGQIAGAGLDVYEEEPLPLESSLRRLPNVLLSAHAANASPRCWEAVHIRTLEGLFRSLQESS